MWAEHWSANLAVSSSRPAALRRISFNPKTGFHCAQPFIITIPLPDKSEILLKRTQNHVIRPSIHYAGYLTLTVELQWLDH